ncbi:MAG: virulence RhuM family protein [Bacteroidales bacterium]|nr:virulence RhuM family protein [Bacteroidales bacterium]
MKESTLPQTTDSEIILYNPDDTIRIEVRMSEETVWLNRNQIATLFGRDVKTIGKHINNALREELAGLSTVAKFATVQNENGRLVQRQIEYYNLDMILSVGYRVKSQQGILFRRWANNVLRGYLLRGYNVNEHLKYMEQRIDNKLQEHTEQIHKLSEQVDFFVRTSLPPLQGIFYDGQIFDAYTFACDLIRSAKKQIVLFDNYVDDSVLTMLDKRSSGVSVRIFTKSISHQLQLDIDRHNAQYPPLTVDIFHNAHDRFLCIDNTIYHIGASLKDLDKKWFAFCKMEMPAADLLSNI